MFTFIANLKIFKKVAIGVVSVLIPFAAALVWNCFSMSRLESLFDEYRGKAEAMTLAEKLLNDMKTYGLLAQAYARVGDESLMDKASDIGGAVNDDVAALRPAIRNPDRLPLLDRADQKNQELAQQVSHVYEVRASSGDLSRTDAGAIATIAAEIAHQSDELGADAQTLVAGLQADQAAIKESTGALIHAALRNLLLALGAGLAAGLAIAFGVARTISRPISAMTQVMTRLANGETVSSIPYAQRSDEVGQMARTMTVFERNLEDNAKLREQARTREEQARKTQREQTLALSDHFEKTVGGFIAGVGSAAQELRDSAEGLLRAAEESAAQAASVTSATRAASTKVQAMAAAAEQLSASIAEIA